MTERDRPVRPDGGATTDTVVGQRQWERPTAFYNRWVKYGLYVSISLFIVWSVWELRVPFDRILIGVDSGAALVSNMWPPDFGPDRRGLIWQGTVESLAMSMVATIIGVGISIPIAFIAAENLVPKPLYYLGRSMISISRSFHELVIAILVVKAVGIGPFAGVITLVFGTVGFFSKLLAEDLEDIHAGQMEAVRATGASTLQVWLFGVLPQVVPRIVALTVYRWDINIRASTVIGIVGAGGIGITLLSSFDRYAYDFTLAIILVIIGLVLIGEAVSVVARRRVQ